MKIVFLEAVQSYGGARISTVELASNLSKNHDVSIYDIYGCCQPFVDSCKAHNINLKIIKPSKKPYIINSKSLFTHIVNVVRFPFHAFILNKKIISQLNKFHADYIIVNSSKMLFYLFFLRPNAKVILFARGWFLPKQISLIDRFLYRKMVDKFVCVSEATRHAVYASNFVNLSDIFVVHNSVNENKIASIEQANIEKQNDECVIMMAAGFLQTKGIHIAIEVAKRLKDLGFKYKLIIAGIIYPSYESKNYYKQILALIDKYALNDYIKLIVDKSNVIAYFKCADIIIHPSDTEGLPRVVMEAMILKKPVIANAVGGVTDYILNGFTGFITRFNNIDDYVNYIMLLYSDKDLYKAISQRAYDLVKENFTIEKQVESFNRIF